MRRAERRVYLAYGPSVVSCCAPPSLKHTHTQQISTENRLDYIQRIVTDWEASSEWVCVPCEGFEPALIMVNAIPIKTGTGVKNIQYILYICRLDSFALPYYQIYCS